MKMYDCVEQTKIALNPLLQHHLQLNNELLYAYLLMCLLPVTVSCEAARCSFSQFPYILQNMDADLRCQGHTTRPCLEPV
jgi:hypothetical protein